MSLQVRKQHHKQSQLTSAREEQNKMKVTRLRQKATDKYTTEVIEYSSLSEFYDYIMNTPYNKTFEHRSYSSETGSREFLDKKEILLPDTIVKDVNKITSVEDLENL